MLLCVCVWKKKKGKKGRTRARESNAIWDKDKKERTKQKQYFMPKTGASHHSQSTWPAPLFTLYFANKQIAFRTMVFRWHRCFVPLENLKTQARNLSTTAGCIVNNA